jgi:hypothetical protein
MNGTEDSIETGFEQNRELERKLHEPHAAFGHCAKLRAEIKFDGTEKSSQWKGS